MNKVIGNTVGLPNPRTDWSQSDKTKADYLKNKEELKKELDGKADALILESEKATPLVLTDTKEGPLLDYKIYGNADGVGGEYDESTGMFMIPVTVYGKNLLKTVDKSDVYKDGVTTNDDYSITVKKGQNLGMMNGKYIPVNVRVSNTAFRVNNDGVNVTASCEGVSSEIFLVVYHSPLLPGEVDKYFILTSGKKTYSNVPKGTAFKFFIQVPAQGIVSKDTTLYPQLELGSVATPYEKYVEPVTVNIPMPHYMGEGDYVDFKNKKVVSEGVTYENVDLPEITTNYPSTSLICGGEMEVTYKADTTNAYKNLKSELDTLKQAIISVGGTL